MTNFLYFDLLSWIKGPTTIRPFGESDVSHLYITMSGESKFSRSTIFLRISRVFLSFSRGPNTCLYLLSVKFLQCDVH